jgi:hypothetical protein
METVGKLLLVIGIVTAAEGLILVIGSRLPFMGRLPVGTGDGRLGMYAPVAVSIVASIILTAVFGIIDKR